MYPAPLETFLNLSDQSEVEISHKRKVIGSKGLRLNLGYLAKYLMKFPKMINDT